MATVFWNVRLLLDVFRYLLTIFQEQISIHRLLPLIQLYLMKIRYFPVHWVYRAQSQGSKGQKNFKNGPQTKKTTPGLGRVDIRSY